MPFDENIEEANEPIKYYDKFEEDCVLMLVKVFELVCKTKNGNWIYRLINRQGLY